MMSLLEKAIQYCERFNRIIVESPILGEGEDGRVWNTRNGTALKISEREENYRNELECYKRLTKNSIFEMDGLAIPRLVDFDDEFLAIEMTIVQEPYLLDFGKVWIDRDPPYIDEPMIIADLHERIRDDFGINTDTVHAVLYKLKQLGIYYADPRPKNISFGELD